MGGTGRTCPVFSVTDFLQSHTSMVVAAVLALLLSSLRAGLPDSPLRRDLSGAVYLFIASLLFRTLAWGFNPLLPEPARKALNVAWMLALAFGLVRMSVSFVLALLRLRRTPTPKILRDVIDFSLYAIVAIPILKAELQFDLGSLVATSAVLSLVLGLALQDTLGNLFAGLSIQLERPFQVGDYIKIRDHVGRVVEITWRATRIETLRKENITLPNNILSKEEVMNFSRAAAPVAVDLYFGASYSTPPNQVRSSVLDVLAEIPVILKEPSSKCRVWHFDDSSIRYQIRYYVANWADSDNVMDEIWSRLWYKLRREGIEIPFPQRVLTVKRERHDPHEVEPALLVEVIRTVDLLSALSSEEIQRLAQELRTRRFGRGEKIIEEGGEGNTFYVVVAGTVSVRAKGSANEVGRLGRGQYFGEMSLLTGDKRAATVVAAEDVVLLEIDRPSFSRLFEAHPDLARQLSALLAQRRSELKAAVENSQTAGAGPDAGKILNRLKQIFGLRD